MRNWKRLLILVLGVFLFVPSVFPKEAEAVRVQYFNIESNTVKKILVRPSIPAQKVYVEKTTADKNSATVTIKVSGMFGGEKKITLNEFLNESSFELGGQIYKMPSDRDYTKYGRTEWVTMEQRQTNNAFGGVTGGTGGFGTVEVKINIPTKTEWEEMYTDPIPPVYDTEYTKRWEVYIYYVGPTVKDVCEVNGVTEPSGTGQLIDTKNVNGSKLKMTYSFKKPGTYRVEAFPVSNKGNFNWDGKGTAFNVAVPQKLVNKPSAIPPKKCVWDVEHNLSGGGGMYKK